MLQKNMNEKTTKKIQEKYLLTSSDYDHDSYLYNR